MSCCRRNRRTCESGRGDQHGPARRRRCRTGHGRRAATGLGARRRCPQSKDRHPSRPHRRIGSSRQACVPYPRQSLSITFALRALTLVAAGLRPVAGADQDVYGPSYDTKRYHHPAGRGINPWLRSFTPMCDLDQTLGMYTVEPDHRSNMPCAYWPTGPPAMHVSPPMKPPPTTTETNPIGEGACIAVVFRAATVSMVGADKALCTDMASECGPRSNRKRHLPCRGYGGKSLSCKQIDEPIEEKGQRLRGWDDTCAQRCVCARMK